LNNKANTQMLLGGSWASLTMGMGISAISFPAIKNSEDRGAKKCQTFVNHVPCR